MGITVDIWKLLSSIVLIILFWKGFWLILSGVGWLFRFIKDLFHIGKDKLLDKLGFSSEDDDDDD